MDDLTLLADVQNELFQAAQRRLRQRAVEASSLEEATAAASTGFARVPQLLIGRVRAGRHPTQVCPLAEHTHGMTVDVERLALEMWSVARAEEQCARVVPDAAAADEVRERIRRLAAADGVAVRTARMDDAVVVVRLDAKVWSEDAATMRRLLTPGTDQT